LAAKAATAIIPVVFVIGGDPVQAGLVASLNRPGGNATGMTILATELAPKLLELLRELIPTSTVFALLINPTNPGNAIISRDVQRAAGNIKLYEVHVLHASTEHDFDKVFATLPQLRADGLVIGADPLFTARVDQLAALALRYKLPAIYNLREFATAGGLVSYGTSIMDAHRLAGLHAGRILKGEKPAELPVLQSVKFEMVINLKTAKVLGLAIPPTLLTRADQVIE
jgi:putative ABC transport system substrate-binding protein